MEEDKLFRKEELTKFGPPKFYQAITFPSTKPILENITEYNIILDKSIVDNADNLSIKDYFHSLIRSIDIDSSLIEKYINGEFKDRKVFGIKEEDSIRYYIMFNKEYLKFPKAYVMKNIMEIPKSLFDLQLEELGIDLNKTQER